MSLRSEIELHLGQSYLVERELGGGGMARVFLATDRSLGRRVVIKVLSPDIAAELSARRFQREIRLAASLQHPNIVPLLAAGPAEHLPYYTMPFVDGQSLQERLAAGRPDVAETIGILRDVARALAYAHDHGVVHRDIKPANILLAADAAVVTDFGIARAIASARADGRPAVSTLTVAGTAIGTPAYMAPEQISMAPDIDHRADLYSLGCVGYELLTGRQPFEGSSAQALFAAHLTRSPRPVTELNVDAPPELAELVMRCLAKEPADRPQSARDILRVVERTSTRAGGVTGLTKHFTGSARRAVAGLSAVAVIVVVALLVSAVRRPRPLTTALAVIPFLSATPDSADYLAEGIADGLATTIGRVPGVRIISRSSMYRYRGRRDVDAREIGKETGADHIVRFTVQQSGQALRVSAQLLDAAENREEWSDIYSRRAADAFAVQDDVARQIAAELRHRLGRALGSDAAAATSVSSSGTSNPEAYDLYLRGRYLLSRRGRGVRQATEHFQQAIARDSEFAKAYAALALSLELLVYFEPVRTDSIALIAVPAAKRALARDSTLSEAHTALALAHEHAYDWSAAEESMQRALALSPNDAEGHIQYGRLLHYTGRPREAEVEFVRARQLDPQSAIASGWRGHMLDLRGQEDSAIAELHRALEIDSTSPPALFMMAEAQLARGDTAAAVAFARRVGTTVGLPLWRIGIARVLSLAGDTTASHELLRAESLQLPGVGNTIQALAYLGVRDTTRALAALERAALAREPFPTWYSMVERYVDPLRRSERFRRVLRLANLDDRIFMSANGGRLAP